MKLPRLGIAVGLLAALLLLPLGGCGGGGSSSGATPNNNWDQMTWDSGNWG